MSFSQFVCLDKRLKFLLNKRISVCLLDEYKYSIVRFRNNGVRIRAIWTKKMLSLQHIKGIVLEFLIKITEQGYEPSKSINY